VTDRAGRVVWAGGGGACVWPWSSSLDARFSGHFLVLNGTLPQRCRLSAALHRGPFFGTRCDIHLRNIFRRFADNDRPVAATVSSEIVCLLRARVLGHTINGHGNTERLHTGRLFPQGSLREQRLGTRKPAGNCHGSFVPTCSQMELPPSNPTWTVPPEIEFLINTIARARRVFALQGRPLAWSGVTCSPRLQPRISWIRRGAEDDAAEPVH